MIALLTQKLLHRLIYLLLPLLLRSLDSVFGMVARLWAGQLRNRGLIPCWGKGIFILSYIQTSCGTHPISCSMIAIGVKLTIHLYPLPRLRMCGARPPLPPYALMTCTGTDLCFYRYVCLLWLFLRVICGFSGHSFFDYQHKARWYLNTPLWLFATTCITDGRWVSSFWWRNPLQTIFLFYFLKNEI